MSVGHWQRDSKRKGPVARQSSALLGGWGATMEASGRGAQQQGPETLGRQVPHMGGAHGRGTWLLAWPGILKAHSRGFGRGTELNWLRVRGPREE